MWLAAVCSLMNSVAPISRLLMPRATRHRISTSRADSSSGWRLVGAAEPSARTRPSSAGMPMRSASAAASPSSAPARSRSPGPRASSMRAYS